MATKNSTQRSSIKIRCGIFALFHLVVALAVLSTLQSGEHHFSDYWGQFVAILVLMGLVLLLVFLRVIKKQIVFLGHQNYLLLSAFGISLLWSFVLVRVIIGALRIDDNSVGWDIVLDRLSLWLMAPFIPLHVAYLAGIFVNEFREDKKFHVIEK